jgi:general secretion pathway protein G
MKNPGFTLIEMLMVIILIGILAGISIDRLSEVTDERSFNATQVKLEQIRAALIGDPTAREGGARSSFGYLGDVGGFPTNAQGLNALITRPTAAPAVSAYTTNATYRIGLGWRGPYITASGVSSVSWTDGWGNPLNYTIDPTNVVVKSLGADNASGGSGYNQDLNITLTVSDYFATVRGFISTNGSAATAEAELYKPDGNGNLSIVSLTGLSGGYFTATNVPLGKRSLKIYLPTISGATSNVGPVTFTVDQKNYEIPANLLETEY